MRKQLLGKGLSRLPHAMLLAGTAGIGKTVFAEELAALLLCESITPGLTACGACQACHWLDSGSHPDFRRVAPEGDEEGVEGANDKPQERAKKRSASMIKIDQIRELEGFVFVGSHRGGNRVILISEADAMNQAAENALLKILEEPPANVYFILITSIKMALLATVRSRCRVINFGVPDSAAAAAWLEAAGHQKHAARYLGLAGGAPMRVAQWSEEGQIASIDALVDSLASPSTDPMALAARWDGLLKTSGLFRLENLVEGIQRWVFDLAQQRIAGEVRFHGGWPRPNGVDRLSPTALLAALREINQFRRSARHPLNQLLFLESMAAHYLRALRPA